ncbi:MAG: hypothetical protein OEZ65_02550 [Gemmatimonadota bacterium]|nr:hypothetical protein [Gemmatimonadota bacterium]MDH5758442.1 hypothetical protein [Gemmatimonadota bacterium]
MPKPPAELVVQWREMAEEGYLYAEIARKYRKYSVDQVRHYCLGHTGRNLGGPIQQVDRWYGSNVWLRGENSPHAQISDAAAKAVLDDWDEESDRWGSSGAEWARELGVSPSTIYMLRRGETWTHLEHPNQGRKPRKKKKTSKKK